MSLHSACVCSHAQSTLSPPLGPASTAVAVAAAAAIAAASYTLSPAYLPDRHLAVVISLSFSQCVYPRPGLPLRLRVHSISWLDQLISREERLTSERPEEWTDLDKDDNAGRKMIDRSAQSVAEAAVAAHIEQVVSRQYQPERRRLDLFLCSSVAKPSAARLRVGA